MTDAQGVIFCAVYALLLAGTVAGTLRFIHWRQDRPDVTRSRG